jgi:Uma2 family endonuclease
MLTSTPTLGDVKPERPKLWRWTREQYYELFDAGILAGRRVELVFGRIVEMPPQRFEHSVALELATIAVQAAFPKGFRHRFSSPIHVGIASAPEPDIAIVPGSPRDLKEHPSHAVLIIEISETSLAYDRSTKARLYAQAGIQDYWIVNLVDRQLEVHRGPQSKSESAPAHYASVEILKGEQSIAPLAAASSVVRVADLLP